MEERGLYYKVLLTILDEIRNKNVSIKNIKNKLPKEVFEDIEYYYKISPLIAFYKCINEKLPFFMVMYFFKRIHFISKDIKDILLANAIKARYDKVINYFKNDGHKKSLITAAESNNCEIFKYIYARLENKNFISDKCLAMVIRNGDNTFLDFVLSEEFLQNIFDFQYGVIEAIIKNNTKVLDILINRYNITEKTLTSCKLQAGISSNNSKLIQEAIHDGALPIDKNFKKASKKNNLNLIQELLVINRCAKINDIPVSVGSAYVDTLLKTALFISLRRGYVDLTRYLIEQNAEYNYITFLEATKGGDTHYIDYYAKNFYGEKSHSIICNLIKYGHIDKIDQYVSQYKLNDGEKIELKYYSPCIKNYINNFLVLPLLKKIDMKMNFCDLLPLAKKGILLSKTLTSIFSFHENIFNISPDSHNRMEFWKPIFDNKEFPSLYDVIIIDSDKILLESVDPVYKKVANKNKLSSKEVLVKLQKEGFVSERCFSTKAINILISLNLYKFKDIPLKIKNKINNKAIYEQALKEYIIITSLFYTGS